MKLPTATYRVQLRQGVDFDRLIETLPHIHGLGVSHVYLPPVFTAVSGSTHGYDVADFNAIDPVLGGREGFEKLAERTRALGLKLILDIVPNHMAASVENGWWRDVLEKGAHSAFARHFDIDWRERLTLPHLDRPFAAAVAAGDMALKPGSDGVLALFYRDAPYPLSRESLVWLQGETAGEAAALPAFSRAPESMAQLHRRQHWQLSEWRHAARHLSYRRFFEITGLAGLRVEDPVVFEDLHRLTLELVKSGAVDGLRIDHVDGLADPAAYLQRLRQAAGEDTFIVVEKILAPGETLPPGWPVQGATGYEFIEAASHVFVSASGLEVLEAHYRCLAPGMADYEAGRWRAKLERATHNFAGEVARLVSEAACLCPAFAPDRLARAIRALLAAFPVYRTYGAAGVLAPADAAVVEKAVAIAKEHGEDAQALDAVAGLLRGGEAAAEFRTRFQQLSGPIMAKAVEDTLFYRHNVLIARNEVGCEPGLPPGSADAFHAAMHLRLKTHPNGLTATSTHDTKRGEDARCRLYALSEAPDAWAENVRRWRRMNAPFVTGLAGGPAPEPEVEWLLCQALLGVLPVEGREQGLRDRFTAYALKALREADLRTHWTEPDEAYEQAVLRYAAALFENSAFLADFTLSAQPFIAAGRLNSLAQTLFKMMAPGIPDFYQGTESGDFSLVDPDNRRPVDHAAPLAHDGLAKADLIRCGLRLRQASPLLFSEGDYVPLRATGRRAGHVLAFARRHGTDFVIALAPVRMVLAGGPSFWGETRLEFPAGLDGPKRDLLSGVSHGAGAALPISALLSRPLALLVGEAMEQSGGQMV